MQPCKGVFSGDEHWSRPVQWYFYVVAVRLLLWEALVTVLLGFVCCGAWLVFFDFITQSLFSHL